jgi:hypothetical protein
MLLKLPLWLCFFLVSVMAAAQTATIKGTVKADNAPLEMAIIGVEGRPEGTHTNSQGEFSLTVPADEDFDLNIRYLGFIPQTFRFNLEPGQVKVLQVTLRKSQTDLGPVEVKGKSLQDTREQVSITKLDPKTTRFVPSAFNDFSKVLATLPGVTSNNELSSTYSVRGGNYDENLVYVNGIEIYRPFLVTNGQQEGLSFVNPDLAGDVEFSSGGWQPKYGDKLSSVLNIQYKAPQTFAASATGGLLGGTAHVEGASANKKISYLLGTRYKNSQYILNSLQVEGDYRPLYADVQSYIQFNLTRDSVYDANNPGKTSIGVLTSYARNKYEVIPTTRETTFGAINVIKRLVVGFDGRENMNYGTFQGGVNLTHQFTYRYRFELIVSGMNSTEREFRDLESGYRFCDVNTDPNSDQFNECIRSRDIGSLFEHARNQLNAKVFSAETRNTWRISDKSEIQWGLKAGRELITDKIQEWQFFDSADYVSQTAYLKTDINLQSVRYNAYVQQSIEIDSLKTLTYGIRASYWTYNGQATISPRIQYSFLLPQNPNLSFKTALGVYHQPPFYRELRNLQGELNRKLKAQRAIHAIAGSEYLFKAYERDFKLVSEIYYKHLTNVVPYDVDNVRLRYYARNNARAYATGADLRVNGEFIKGAESWFSLGLLRTHEDIEGDSMTTYGPDGTITGKKPIGFIPRPTDQLLTVGVFFQDQLPNNPSLKGYLNIVYGTRRMFSPPGEPELRSMIRGRSYKRVDVGFSKLITLREENNPKFGLESLWIGLEILNIIDAKNLMSFNYVTDVTGVTYSVPNYLTSRTINLRFIARF